TLLSVCDLKDDLQTVNALAGLDQKTPPPEELRVVSTLGLPQANDKLAESLYLPQTWLQQALDLLHEKRQLIFYGPPGTGKTFVAQALGEHIRAAGGDWQLVQFHPAYSYEDFFEGYRPSQPEPDGALRFDLRGGPLRLLAEQAAMNPTRSYLLVIDEINRGNIAKIFGELYFLLEYREHPIRLQYSPEQPFVLPKNLFVIGTMNTSDRSIALVDSALRRRFYFLGFLPNQSPVREVLSLWLQERGYGQEAAHLLELLNLTLQQALPDEGFAIGPSYLMPKEGEPNLERIWSHAILPLIEERFYGVRPAEELEGEFGLEAIRTRLQADEDSSEHDAQADLEPVAS
ncbi:MAG: McrB family protein, partial [Solirubrobacteraceae bacterium]